MSYKVKQSRIALQIRPQVHLPIDDLIQIINRRFIITASEIERCNLVIKHKHPMPVEEQLILIQFLFYIGHNLQSFGKSAFHEMLIDLGYIQVNKGLNLVIITLINYR